MYILEFRLIFKNPRVNFFPSSGILVLNDNRTHIKSVSPNASPALPQDLRRLLAGMLPHKKVTSEASADGASWGGELEVKDMSEGEPAK